MSVTVDIVRGLGLATILSLLIVTAATAQTPAKAEAKKERLICKGLMTGTRIRSQRICMTADQWRVDKERNSADLAAGREQQNVVRYGTGGRSTCTSSISC